MNTIRDDRDTDDLAITQVVEVPTLRPPRLREGPAFHARAPQETDIDLIASDEWDTVMLEAHQGRTSYQYAGQTTVDGVRVNVWFMGETEGFLAQSLTA